MLYQFETPNPGNIYRMRMRLENDTDLASRLNVPLTFAAYGGLWKPRVAIVTPSSTMLGSEGIPPDGMFLECRTHEETSPKCARLAVLRFLIKV